MTLGESNYILGSSKAHMLKKQGNALISHLGKIIEIDLSYKMETERIIQIL